MPFGEYVDAVADAFRMHAQGRAASAAHAHSCRPAGFHVKAGLLPGRVCRLQGQRQLPRQWCGSTACRPFRARILLFDASTGSPVALLDLDRDHDPSVPAQPPRSRPTISRGPSSAPSRSSAAVCKARVQLTALRHDLDIRQVFLVDKDAAAAEAFASGLADEGLDVDVPVRTKEARAGQRRDRHMHVGARSFLGPADVRAGTFGTKVADPEKTEVEPALLKKARVMTDLTEQCSYMGDLHHAIAAGEDANCGRPCGVGDLFAGTKPGRSAPEEITLFDGSGVGIQDVAAAFVPSHLPAN